ncbi:unnamed protein product [Lepidochelys kempii]
MPPPNDVVKIAIQMMGAIPQLIELNQAKPLAAVVKEVCDVWTLGNAEHYALQYVDGQQTYITESNRVEIKNGSILRLTTSPDQEAERLHSGIRSNNLDVKADSLKKLANLSRDITFAQEFINRNGLKQLFLIVEEGNDIGEILAHTLKAFMELMEHDFVSWETLSRAFIRKIVKYVNASGMDASVQQLSLSILENMVPSSRSLFELVKHEVTLDRLLTHLQVTNQQLQLKAMALLIALLLNANDTERRDMMGYLGQRKIRQFIHKNIIHASEPMGDEMAHYLYVLQSNHPQPAGVEDADPHGPLFAGTTGASPVPASERLRVGERAFCRHLRHGAPALSVRQGSSASWASRTTVTLPRTCSTRPRDCWPWTTWSTSPDAARVPIADLSLRTAAVMINTSARLPGAASS